VEYVIAWSGFLGAWLLVAGPVYQAAIELEEENEGRDRVAAASERVRTPARISAWWWLLPPVAYLLNRRRNRSYRQAVFEALTTEEMEAFVRFSAKATGWLFVALGAFFIALKETWEVGELSEWPGWVFGVLVVLMVVLSALNTVLRMRRAHDMLGAERAAAGAEVA
jgi:hypothetical protein